MIDSSNKFDPAPLVRAFPAEQQETAEWLAMLFALMVGQNAPRLRAESTLEEIFEWCIPTSSGVELIMALEEEVGCEIPDHLAENLSDTTFRDLVAFIAENTNR
jgi:hypothetical protein